LATPAIDHHRIPFHDQLRALQQGIFAGHLVRGHQSGLDDTRKSSKPEVDGDPFRTAASGLLLRKIDDAQRD
jgi:hypothetical protein